MRVYDALYMHGPATGSELAVTFKRLIPNANISARLSELRDLGVAREKGIKKCDITGMKVILWDVTSGLPKTPIKKLTREQKLNIATRALKMIKTEQDARGKHLSNNGKIRCAIAALEKIGCDDED